MLSTSVAMLPNVAGATSCVLDLGRNLVVFGPEVACAVGIQNPIQESETIGEMRAEDVSIATSGGYERFITIDDEHYSHILDPRTGIPTEGIRSATAVSPDASEANALATACVVLDVRACLDLINERDGVGVILINTFVLLEAFGTVVTDGI